ncbi:MAG: hypothetical protein IIZ38_20090 [Sphingomonas sp.]|uniref:hypothetical protein n=1 Tax=Sphingomonas sp. TaxID=28214 RepID=UPI0025F8CB80|nr:hypothetical protein [Sphingomonas sp.]MBQ1500615.1 hypothetical protein [Sphingomonas sp.]MBQ8102891.1 hypothetical protein [Afipia sp.]
MTPDIMAAREEVRQRRAYGILYLSKGLGGAALKGRPGAGAALIVNGAYFVRAEGIARALGVRIPRSSRAPFRFDRARDSELIARSVPRIIRAAFRDDRAQFEVGSA